MTKPDDIPQDVWDAANMVSAVWKMPGSDNHLALTVEIGLAIMAEREACARVLDEGYDRIGIVTKHDKCTHGIWDWDDCDQCAAAAIRNRRAA